MDKVALLEEFYQTMKIAKVKVENKNFGFAFIDKLIIDGTELDYIQMENNFIHKYRLLNVTKERRKALLLGHVNKEYNTCLYFNEIANNVLCFNIDNNFKANNNEIIPELGQILRFIEAELRRYAIVPVNVKSGRGYHQWCRFSEPIPNQLLLDFMIRITARALAALHFSGHDYHTVKVNMSPNPKFVKKLSLRVFGSQHIRTGNFSYIETDERVLDEAESWQYFRDAMSSKTAAKENFMQAYEDLIKAIPLS